MIDTNVIHDPEKLLADLRQHLAGHDKPIGFLFGAGTSCAVRAVRPGETSASPLIPDVKGLTSQCKDAATRADSTFRLAWEELEERCEARKESTNIENILSRLAVMRDAIGPRDRLVGLDRSDLERLEGHSLLEGGSADVMASTALGPSRSKSTCWMPWVRPTAAPPQRGPKSPSMFRAD